MNLLKQAVLPPGQARSDFEISVDVRAVGQALPWPHAASKGLHAAFACMALKPRDRGMKPARG